MPIIDLMGVVVLTVSVLLLAWQTREVARQTELNLQVSAVSVQNDVSALLQVVQTLVVERPHVRPFLYDNEPLPASGPARWEVLLIAEMLADVLEAMLENGYSLPSFGDVNLEDIKRYGLRVMRDSEAVRLMVADRGEGEWPRLWTLGEDGS